MRSSCHPGVWKGEEWYCLLFDRGENYIEGLHGKDHLRGAGALVERNPAPKKSRKQSVQLHSWCFQCLPIAAFPPPSKNQTQPQTLGMGLGNRLHRDTGHSQSGRAMAELLDCRMVGKWLKATLARRVHVINRVRGLAEQNDFGAGVWPQICVLPWGSTS